jgi:hypothetical protein
MIMKALGPVSVEYTNISVASIMKRLQHIREILNLMGEDKGDARATIHGDVRT